MDEPVDLMSAVQSALFRALKAAETAIALPVFDVVPQDHKGSFVKVGSIGADGEGAKSDQLERIEAEVQVIYRGKNRGELLGALHRVRVAIVGAALTTDGAELHGATWLNSVASDATGDGVTYAGISNFEIYAEPA